MINDLIQYLERPNLESLDGSIPFSEAFLMLCIKVLLQQLKGNHLLEREPMDMR